MDGSLDTSKDLWRSSAGPVTPLGLDVKGNLICPLCARKVFSERLGIVAGTELFGCNRGHRFQLRGLSV